MSDRGRRLKVGLVGLGFGREFVPIYLHHPSVESVTLCDLDGELCDEVKRQYGADRTVSSFEKLLDTDIDAIHLVTPIPLHARQTVAVLTSGKHCACTVPMAISLEDIESIAAAQQRTGKTYMMMETAVYTREFLYVRDRVSGGGLGRIQFLRGAHYQDMEGWPAYWRGLPPMYYATHAIAPLLMIAEARATEVRCCGSGWMRPELRSSYGNPYPIETAILSLARCDNGSSGRQGSPRGESGEAAGVSAGAPDIQPPLAAEVTRSLFHTAREYTECFNVYGDRATFEWQQIERDPPILFSFRESEGQRGRPVEVERVEVPDRQELLPPDIRRFTRRSVYDESNPHRSFLQGGGHGGSHPHLVHEFLSSILEEREPAVGVVRAAEITAAGICAHQSAIDGAKAVSIPDYRARLRAAEERSR